MGECLFVLPHSQPRVYGASSACLEEVALLLPIDEEARNLMRDTDYLFKAQVVEALDT